MYRVLNKNTEEIITEFLEYDDAVSYMNELNSHSRKKHIARNWTKDEERELYQDIEGNVLYGSYVIVYGDNYG